MLKTEIVYLFRSETNYVLWGLLLDGRSEWFLHVIEVSTEHSSYVCVFDQTTFYSLTTWQ